LTKNPGYWSGSERVKNTQVWRVDNPDWAKEKKKPTIRGRACRALKIPVSTVS